MCWRVVELVVLGTAAQELGPLIIGIRSIGHDHLYNHVLAIIVTAFIKCSEVMGVEALHARP